MDIDSLSRPYDPELDDQEEMYGEMPVQHFAFGGPIDAATHLDPTTEAARVTELNAMFEKAPGGFQNQVSNAPKEQTNSRNPYVMTMPIDPDTGAPAGYNKYLQTKTENVSVPGKLIVNGQVPDQEATSRKMLEEYTKAVNDVPYYNQFNNKLIQPQMPTTQDFIARQNKLLPALGRKQTVAEYGTAANPNYMPFPRAVAPVAAAPATGSTGGNNGGEFEIQVTVYGPDGTVYSSPSRAREAGVFNYTSTPPAKVLADGGLVTNVNYGAY